MDTHDQDNENDSTIEHFEELRGDMRALQDHLQGFVQTPCNIVHSSKDCVDMD